MLNDCLYGSFAVNTLKKDPSLSSNTNSPPHPTPPHPAVTDDNSEYLYPYTGSAMHGFQLEPSAACTLCSIKVSKQINMHGGERSFITLPLNASYTTVYTEVTTRAPPRQNQYLSKCIHRTFDTLSFLKTHNTRYGFHKHGAIRVIHKPT